MDEITFFEQLRQETETAFQSSPVKKKQDSYKRQWNYSICGTPIRRKRGVIFGLNWGGGGDKAIDLESGELNSYPPPPQMPDGSDI